jgi:hypothetical protein
MSDGVAFDVYAGADPLEPFRRNLALNVLGLSAEVSGLASGAVHYFTVIARRGADTSLPSRVLALPLASAAADGGLTERFAPPSGPIGLGFPFSVTLDGRMSTLEADALLRSRIVQLLLTAPGERVNLPEFGTRLRDLVFDPNSDVLAATTEFMIGRALNKYFGDEVAVERVAVLTTEQELAVELTYLRKRDLSAERVRLGVPR